MACCGQSVRLSGKANQVRTISVKGGTKIKTVSQYGHPKTKVSFAKRRGK